MSVAINSLTAGIMVVGFIFVPHIRITEDGVPSVPVMTTHRTNLNRITLIG